MESDGFNHPRGTLGLELAFWLWAGLTLGVADILGDEPMDRKLAFSFSSLLPILPLSAFQIKMKNKTS